MGYSEKISEDRSPRVAVVMGSKSDWDTMRHAHETLAKFEVPHESRILSAHRTPEQTSSQSRCRRRSTLAR